VLNISIPDVKSNIIPMIFYHILTYMPSLASRHHLQGERPAQAERFGKKKVPKVLGKTCPPEELHS